MKVLLKDESLWPCTFSPLTFTTAKLEEFVKVAIGIGKIHTCYDFLETADDNKRGFVPIPLSSKVLTRFLPLLNLSEDGLCNLKEQMQMFILSILVNQEHMKDIDKISCILDYKIDIIHRIETDKAYACGQRCVNEGQISLALCF